MKDHSALPEIRDFFIPGRQVNFMVNPMDEPVKTSRCLSDVNRKPPKTEGLFIKNPGDGCSFRDHKTAE